MKRHTLVILYTILLVFLSIASCKKDEKGTTKVTTKDTLSALDFHINQFIWISLHDYYLWVDNVPDLASTRFTSDTAMDNYLNRYSDHEKFFYGLLYKYGTIDKWSWIVDDYVALEQQFQGITLSMGYNFRLVKFSNSNDVFGFVRYVVKGGPADIAGIKRGDVFMGVDNQQITTSNYQSLFSGKTSYTLNLATISNHTVTPSNRNVTITAAEVHEDPIYLNTIYNIGGKKTGYLVYNGFYSDYDVELNDVFKQFKDQGVQQLILDLRYNPGGSINSATYLSSMIYSTDTTKLFFTARYNKYVQAYFDSAYGTKASETNFADKIKKTDSTSETPINSLGLNKVYIIATGSSASASELVIAGLKPYIDVITIGTRTYGKYVGSITIKDYDNKGVVNPNHKWALQPIILKTVNSAGLSDYVNGFAPTDSVQEDIANLLSLGNTNETLLKATIDYIKGSSKKSYVSASDLQMEKVADSRDFIPHSYEMYFKIPLKKLRKNTK